MSTSVSTHCEMAIEDGRWLLLLLRTIKTMKINDRSIHMKMYEMLSIYEICRHCQTIGHHRTLAARTYAKVVWQRRTHTHTHLFYHCFQLICPFFVIYRAVPTHLLWMHLYVLFLALHRDTRSATIPSDEHECAQKTNTRSKRTNIDILVMNFLSYEWTNRTLQGSMQCNLRKS